jgi:signal peptidase I
MQSIKSFLKESLWVVVLSVVIVFPIRMYIAQPFVVSGSSMDHTFANGNYLVVDELSYRFENPNRGDVIIFKVPKGALELSHYSLDKTVYFIKRIIGLPGETVEVKGDQVTIYNDANPKGMTLNEPYYFIDKSIPGFPDINMTKKLGPDEYFVMGDNRHNSSDSRFWGPVNKSDIKGRALVRLFPFNQITALPGVYNQY